MTRRPKWWQWPTILSLDAPAVALAWQALVAAEVRVRLNPFAVVVLGVSVWLSYAADRWLEGWRLRPEQVRTQRHSFYQRLRWAVAPIWILALGADLWAALAGLSAREFWFGAALLPLVLAYVLSHQFVHRDRRWRLPKEICVALLLAGGIAAFAAARLPIFQVGRVIVPIGLFLLLAFGNCALISVWERAVDQSHGQTSLARQFPLGSALGRSAVWVALGCGVVVAGMLPFARAAGVCAATSAALLLWIDWGQAVLGWEAARVLADCALLTPLVALALRL